MLHQQLLLPDIKDAEYTLSYPSGGGGPAALASKVPYSVLIGKSNVLDGQILLSTTSSINGVCISLNLSCQGRAPGPRQISRGGQSVSEHSAMFR